jgi:hypothetical protein
MPFTVTSVAQLILDQPVRRGDKSVVVKLAASRLSLVLRIAVASRAQLEDGERADFIQFSS